MDMGSVSFELVALSRVGGMGGGIYRQHQKSNRYTPLCTTRWDRVKSLGETDQYKRFEL